jgi:POT family proton-dependent oligopeptide transporter
MGFIRDMISQYGLRTLARLAKVYVFIMLFWALFDQTGSSWILQAQKMDRVIFGIELLPSQIQAANPLLIMVLTPLFTYIIYPFVNGFYKLTDLRKMQIGLFLTVIAFAIPSFLQMSIDRGLTPNISWQLFAYVLLTAAEVMVSITCLEFSYRQAPVSMKSFIMACYFLSIAAGNFFTGTVNFMIQNDDGSSKLAGANYFWFFTLIMLITAITFMWASSRFLDKPEHQNS